jgi:hypothetical protein
MNVVQQSAETCIELAKNLWLHLNPLAGVLMRL